MSGAGEQRLAAINCITCGAALPALAGNKAKALICNYCGSVMDRHEDYKLLAQYKDMRRPDGPFTIGMKGKLFGIEQTIIGIIGSEMHSDGERYAWTSYQLFSPTHGYSWLTWSDGHVTHTRKTRDAPEIGANANQYVLQDKLPLGERSFKKFESYTARIFYLEGELTWLPKLRDETWVIEWIDPPYGYAVAKGPNEEEFERSTYLDQEETLAAFGVEEWVPKPVGVHAIQPFIEGWLHGSLARAATYILPLAALSWIGLWILGGGTQITQETIRSPAAGGEVKFAITNAKQLASVKIQAPVRNAWAWYDMELIFDETDETVAEFDRGVEYYSGVSGGESWSEGSNNATLRFKPPATGNYRLQVHGVEAGSANVPLTVTIREGVMLARYPFYLLALLGLVVASLAFRRWRFEGMRWGSFESDDD